MKKILVTAATIVSLFATAIHAQDRICGTEEVLREALRNSPDIQKAIEQNEADYQRKLAEKATQKTAANNYDRQIIPVVFHIMHEYGAENVSEAQCMDALRVLNEDYQRRGADSNVVVSPFFSIRGNANIEFRLARIDPNGNCTNGITRTYTTLTSTAGDNVKDLLSWDTKKYMNVWVGQEIYSGSTVVGGFATFPCTASSPNREGIVVNDNQFGSIGTSYANTQAVRTLSHEAGHYLNLSHTWGNTTCGLPTNCSVDDGVADTPNCIGSSTGVTVGGCVLNQSTCGQLDNVQNIMDYSSCPIMFTEGQADRVRAASDTNSSCIYRNNLSRQANLIATGVNDGYTATCGPVADFAVVGKQICQGSSITYTDISYQATVTSRHWVFEGGTPAISTNSTQTVTYNTPGKYTVKLIVSNANGTDSLVRTQIINVINSPGTIALPYTEGMEQTTWPVNSTTDPLQNWTEESTSSTNWERTTVAFVSGSASARIKVSSIPTGRVNSFISPVIDMSGISSSTHRLYFKLAYAQRTLSGTGSSDQLKILMSTDCGSTWISKYTKIGSSLSTIGTGNVSGSNFIPTTSQWRTEAVSLAQIAGKSAVLIKFECTSNAGSIIYIDDINITTITQNSPEELEQSLVFKIYPNPSDDNATISYTLTESTNVKIAVKDVLGKTIGNSVNEMQSAGAYEFIFDKLAPNTAQGIYFVEFSTEKGTFVKKFVRN